MYFHINCLIKHVNDLLACSAKKYNVLLSLKSLLSLLFAHFMSKLLLPFGVGSFRFATLLSCWLSSNKSNCVSKS